MFVVVGVSSGGDGWVVFEGLRVDSCGVDVVCGVLLWSVRVEPPRSSRTVAPKVEFLGFTERYCPVGC